MKIVKILNAMKNDDISKLYSEYTLVKKGDRVLLGMSIYYKIKRETFTKLGIAK